MQRWTYEQGLALEVAKECMTDWISILVHRLSELPSGAEAAEQELRAQVIALSIERDALELGQDQVLAATTLTYGQLVREFRSSVGSA